MHKLGNIITRTPFRISFFGGGTDMADYFLNENGAVLGTTIDKYTYVTVNSLERLLEKKIRLSYSKLEIVDEPEQLDHAIVRAVLSKHKVLLNGGFLDIHSFADLPSGTGVGSSSSFAVGFLNALYSLNNIFKSPRDIAEEAIHVERIILNEAGGWQDQIHAAFGGFNKIDFFNNQFNVTPICMSHEKTSALESSLMFYFTGLTRSSSEVHKTAKTALAPDAKKFYLKKMYDMVSEGTKILTDASSPSETVSSFGSLLNEAWQCKRQVSENVSNTLIDEIYKSAIKAGALGGKLLGAGSGGFMVFVVRPDKRDDVMSALSQLHQVPVKLDRYGSRVIFAN